MKHSFQRVVHIHRELSPNSAPQLTEKPNWRYYSWIHYFPIFYRVKYDYPLVC